VTWLVLNDIVVHVLMNDDTLVRIKESDVSRWLRGPIRSFLQVLELVVFEKARAKANSPSIN
jgi:hypothetical protein